MSNTEPPTKRTRSDSTYEGDLFELKCINTIRALSADMPQEANSGHPGAPMGCAPMAHLLWSEVMTYSPSNDQWWNRDRFVLSNGHACALQYSMLHLAGYNLTMDDLKQFRVLGSKTPGHPENFMTEGVEVCTGPLGQGLTNAVGMAIGEAHMAATFNTADYEVFNNYTFVICGDGCLQEGITSEASSLAGHLGLGKLIVLYDDNLITIDGSTDLSFTEDVNARYEAYGWHVQTVSDVANGIEDLRTAVELAKGEKDRPSIIKIRTNIGYGSKKENTASAHGSPLGEEDLAYAKTMYGMDPSKKFHIDDDVKELYAKRTEECEKTRKEWDCMFLKYTVAHPEKAAEIVRRFAHALPDCVFDTLPSYTKGKDKDQASRKFSNFCLNDLAPKLTELIGGSADLTPSNLTALNCSGDFQKLTPEGRYLRFGVREHAMVAICNGLYAYGCFRPYCASFLNFAGYALGAIRVSALSNMGIIYIMTHDSIGLGEDGPTHQPVEMIESLRSMPNVNVIRPADCNETAAAYQIAMEQPNTPSVLCFSRSTVVGLANSSAEKTMKGAYIVVEEASPDLIIVASGSELNICIEAAEELSKTSAIKVRVVSMPCQEIFLEQPLSYQLSILPGDVPTLSVEASCVHGWHRFSHVQIGMTRFGSSGKGDELFKHFGFSTENVVTKGKKMVEFYKKAGAVPNLMSRPVFDVDVPMNGST